MPNDTNEIIYITDIADGDIGEVAIALRSAAIRCMTIIKNSSEPETIRELEALGIALVKNAATLESYIRIDPATHNW